MSQDKSTKDQAPDASDVVDGPVGSAWLKDPASVGPIGAEIAELPPIDVPSDDSVAEGRSIDKREG